jgi:glycosyltransferase involved in cell wall biosynthesis
MRLGLVTGEYSPMPGGVGDFTRELAHALADLGVEVHVLTVDRAQAASAPILVHPVLGRWTWLALGQVRGLARRLKLDVLNLQYQAAAYGLALPIHFLPRWAGVRTVVTFHDLRIPYLFPKAGALRQGVVTALARSASGAIVTNQADEAELRRRGGVRRLANIPIGSNITPQTPSGYDRDQWRAGLGVRSTEFLLGYFGFLNASKGGDTLLRALSILKDRQAKVKLVLIGGGTGASDATDAAFAAQLDKLIDRHDLSDRLVRTGFVAAPEVSGHLLACDAVALPYRDGASLRRGSLHAALAHGCAVITTEPSELVPELRDGENIRLVPPDSPPALVLAVTQLLDAPDLRARLGAGALAIAARFRWPRIARQTLDFYESLGG